MLPEIYKDSIELFNKSFDVPKLVFDIVTRIKEPAVEGRVYDAEITSAKMENFKLTIEFKTEENTYFTVIASMDTRMEYVDELLAGLRCNICNVDMLPGCKFKVYYENMFKTYVLGEIE